MSVIQRAWDDAYASFASSAFASDATVETNVCSRLSKFSALSIASFAWWARPASRRSWRSSRSRSPIVTVSAPTRLPSSRSGAITKRRDPFRRSTPSIWATTSGSSTKGSVRPSSHSWASSPGNLPAARRIDVRRIAVRGTSNEVAGRRFFLDPQRCAFGAEHARGHLDAPRQHIVGRFRRRKLAARLEQRVGDLGGLELLAVQAGLLQRHRGLVGKRCEQPLAILVERGRREHQAALDPVALGERAGGALAERWADAGDAGVASHSDAPSVSNSVTAVCTMCSQISSTVCARETTSAKASSALAPSASRRCCS